MTHKPLLRFLFCGGLFSPAPLTASQSPGGPPQKTKAGEVPASAKEEIDVCRLLTSAEIEAVQGEPVRETKPSVQPNGGMRMSQCLYRTATFAKSVTVALVAPAPGKSTALAPRKFWRTQFHPPEPKDEDERPVPGKAPDKVGPQSVGNGITGALYAVLGDASPRMSGGGVRQESARIEKAKALARNIMRRLGD